MKNGGKNNSVAFIILVSVSVHHMRTSESRQKLEVVSHQVLFTNCFMNTDSVILLFSQTYFHLLYNIKVSDFGCSQ